MEVSGYQQFADFEERHFWFRGRRRIFFASRLQAFMQQRRVGRQRRLDIQNRGQDLVLDMDELERLTGNFSRGGRHRGHKCLLLLHLGQHVRT